jgi:hypothetical protein
MSPIARENLRETRGAVLEKIYLEPRKNSHPQITQITKRTGHEKAQEAQRKTTLNPCWPALALQVPVSYFCAFLWLFLFCVICG